MKGKSLHVKILCLFVVIINVYLNVYFTYALQSEVIVGVTEMCISAANFIINKTNQYNEDKSLTEQIFLSSKRLQKLLFFSDVLYMVENDGESMFDDDFYAWPSGPVIPSVYRKFMQYQDGAMRPNDDEDHTSLSREMENVITRVLNDTNSLDTINLIEKSHENGTPWQRIYNKNDTEYNRKIDKIKIYNYYVKNGVPYGSNNKN